MRRTFRLVTGVRILLSEGLMGYGGSEEAVDERHRDFLGWNPVDQNASTTPLPPEEFDSLWWMIGGEG